MRIRNEKGVSNAEYSMVFGLVAIVVIGSLQVLGGSESISATIETASLGVSGESAAAAGLRRPSPTDPEKKTDDGEGDGEEDGEEDGGGEDTVTIQDVGDQEAAAS